MTLFQVRDKDGNVHDIWVGDGADGYTPVRGEDYFTPEDVAQIVEQASAEAKAAAVEEALSVMRAPTLLPQDTWYKGATAKSVVTEIRVVDLHVPTGTETESWNADVEGVGKIKCYLDGSALIISGNGSGRIMANADSKKMFDQFSNVVSIIGLGVIDTRNVTTLLQAFARTGKLRIMEGCANWNVSRCTNYKNFLSQLNGESGPESIDFSGWNVRCAVDAAKNDSSVFSGMLTNCLLTNRIKLNKTFDLSYIALPVPYIGDEKAMWLDTATNATYTDTDSDKTVTTKDGLPNPCMVGRSITFEAVLFDGEEDV